MDQGAANQAVTQCDVLIVGAGASGLAVAATLGRRGRRAILLDRDKRIGGTWARRYDRLCLHTIRRYSGLPFHPIPKSSPRYVPTDCYADYLAEYARKMDLDVRLEQRVERIRRGDDGAWTVATPNGEWHARALVIATGQHNQPRLPCWPGAVGYRGRLLHAGDYWTGREFAGQRALVIGIGNSGAEIAIDLVEQGAAHVAVSVRRAPPIISREVMGIPVQLIGMMMMPFPPHLVDRLGAVLRRIGTGDLRAYGLGKPAWEPFVARRPPVIDVGFLAELKAGRIEVLPDIARFTETGVELVDGCDQAFDVAITATGYTTGLPELIAEPGVLDERGYPREEIAARLGLFFAGYMETQRGQLFESSRAAHGVASAIDRYLEKGP